MELNSVRATLSRAKEDGLNLSEHGLRQIIREGRISVVRLGVKNLIYYPNLKSYLQNGDRENSEHTQQGSIRQIDI